MNIVLKPELEKFIAEKVKAGLYADSSAIVNEALEALKEQDEFTPEYEAYLKTELHRGLEQLDRGERAMFDAESVIAEQRKTLKDRKARP